MSPRKKKKSKDRTLHASNEPIIDKPSENPNDVSISDVETRSGNEHTPSDNDKYDANDDRIDVPLENIEEF